MRYFICLLVFMFSACASEEKPLPPEPPPYRPAPEITTEPILWVDIEEFPMLGRVNENTWKLPIESPGGAYQWYYVYTADDPRDFVVTVKSEHLGEPTVFETSPHVLSGTCTTIVTKTRCIAEVESPGMFLVLVRWDGVEKVPYHQIKAEFIISRE